MSVRVEDYTPELTGNVKQKTSLALRLMLEAVHRISRPNTPKEHGNLRSDVLKEVTGLKGKITWDKNYAIYQEKKQFSNYTTPGTGPHFAQNAVKKVADDGMEYFKKAGLL